MHSMPECYDYPLRVKRDNDDHQMATFPEYRPSATIGATHDEVPTKTKDLLRGPITTIRERKDAPRRSRPSGGTPWSSRRWHLRFGWRCASHSARPAIHNTLRSEVGVSRRVKLNACWLRFPPRKHQPLGEPYTY